MALDFTTIFFGYFVTTMVCMLVVFFLWYQNRKRFEGLEYILIGFIFLTVGLLLILLRKHVPDILSVILSNLLNMAGLLLGLLGLERLIGIKGKHYHNFIALTLYLGIHFYFTSVKPDVSIRNLNSAIFFIFISIQYVLLMFVRAPKFRKHGTGSIGFVYIGFLLVNFIRIFDFLIEKVNQVDYFDSRIFEILIVLSYQILFLLFTFFLVLLINRILINDNAFQKEKYSKSFFATPLAVILTRLSDGKIFEVNDGFFNLTGFNIDEVTNLTTSDILLWKNESDRKGYVEKLSKEGSLKEYEFIFRKKSGNLFEGTISSEILIIDKLLYAISVIADISERKKAEEQLKRYASELEKANDTKDKLFSIIGHDLRSPFSSIVGFSEIIRDEIDSLDKDTLRNYANLVNSSAVYTLDLFQNLLEWARLQQKGISCNPEICDLSSIVNNVRDLLLGAAEKKEIKIISKIEKGFKVKADPNMLTTVIRNLVSNAIKYTLWRGLIEINSISSDGMVTVMVKDTGVGMDEETLSNIFRPGIKSTPGTDREKGTGLGLLLCKEFVESHGGKIKAENNPISEGPGSCFCFTIPLAANE